MIRQFEAPTEIEYTWPPCPVCGEQHDQIINYLLADEPKHLDDGSLASEVTYVKRELVDGPINETLLRHRLRVLEEEERRRQRIAARGGPAYRGRGSIPQEQIAAAKAVNIVDLIARDLQIAWMRGARTYFRCPLHGDGVDRYPSLVAYEDQGRFWCFGCSSGGDAIDWMISRHGLEFRPAVEALT